MPTQLLTVAQTRWSLVLKSLVAAACIVLATTQVPEPNCNSNIYEGNEVWSAVDNFIGPGTGEFWWGMKAPLAAQPVSWVDMCAQRLEKCQADAKVPGALSGFKPTCICDMWSCLNRQPSVSLDARPACQFLKPQLLNFYCSAAHFINATCSDPAYIPLPPGEAAQPFPQKASFTFDDIPGDGIRIPPGYQSLDWYNWFMLDGDGYQVQNGYYAGVISSPKVAFNGYGYPASFSAPDGALLTLHSMYLTSAWDEDNVVTIVASDYRGEKLGTYVTSLSTYNPTLIDIATLPAGVKSGTFSCVKTITITTTGTQVALDNLHITLVPEPGQHPLPMPLPPLEFFPAPPGASSPIRKKHEATPLNRTADTQSWQQKSLLSG